MAEIQGYPKPDIIIERTIIRAIATKDILTLKEMLLKLPYLELPDNQRINLTKRINVVIEDHT